MKYKQGKVTFGSFLAKEHYVTQGNLHTLQYVFNTIGNHMPTSEHELLKHIIKSMKKQEMRMRKQLVKDGYMKSEVLTKK
jgi:hypothetical protein